jgi:hypothetical protein
LRAVQGVVPPESLAGAVSALTSNILKREKHLSVGGVGARWLLQALTAANETSLALDLAAQVRRQPCRFCAIFFNIKTIILPRQARDKHRESTQKESGAFLQTTAPSWYDFVQAGPGTLHETWGTPGLPGCGNGFFCDDGMRFVVKISPLPRQARDKTSGEFEARGRFSH